MAPAFRPQLPTTARSRAGLALLISLLLFPSGCGRKTGESVAPSPAADPPPAAAAPAATATGTLGTLAAATTGDNNAPLSSVLAKADPAGDPQWTTEQFSEEAGTRLNKVLLPYVGDPAQPVPPGLLSADFRSTALRPALTSVFKDQAFEVWRPESSLPAEPALAGEQGFRAAFEPVRQAFRQPAPLPAGDAPAFRGKAKVVRVEPGPKDQPWATLVYVETSRGPVQQNAEWRCTWLPGTAGAPLLLQSIALVRFEEIHASPPEQNPVKPAFVDCTEAVLGANPSWQDQLLRGANHWHGNLDVAFGIHQGNQGVAIADANGDGLEDIYFCQPDGLPNRFFLQQPDGTLRDFSRDSGLDFLDLSRSALLVDLDNDGDADGVLAHRFSVTILENDGTARFRVVRTIDTDSRVSGLSAADYDHDGDLDFYVCGYSPMGQTSPEDIFANPVPYEDANNGAFNHLFRNDGGFAFTDTTEETGLNVNNTRFSFCAAWEDFDNDGDQDLYVANDFGRNNLYRNDLVPSGKPTFTDVAAALGVEDIAASMSVDWADADNDGHMDLYVANMWSSAGNRIAFQQQFKPGSSEETRHLIQRHARGNSFFKNVPGRPFLDASEDSGLTMGRWAWGSNFIDFNNDGWEDIYVANGFMSAPDAGDL
jgi:hypothetical protein